MDYGTQYYAGVECDDRSLPSAVLASDTIWLSLFWTPSALQADCALNSDEFKTMLTDHGITFRLNPHRQHSKNVVEFKHGIFLRISKSYDNAFPSISAQRSIIISNDLYGHDTLSSSKMVNGFNLPIFHAPHILSLVLFDAQETLLAERKLARILRYKTT